MNNRRMEHSSFLERHNAGEVSFFFNSVTTAKAAVSFVEDEKLKAKLNRFLSLKKSEKWVWIAGLISLLTPLKILVLGVMIYSVSVYGLERLTKKHLIDKMVESEEFYNQAVKEGYVIPVWTKEKAH